MTYTKQEFFKELDEIIEDNIYIGSTQSDLDEELKNNTWLISASQEVCNTLTKEEILEFINKLVANRRKQVEQSNKNHGMFFYMWFDEQAVQLRFSLISDSHGRLPFGCIVQTISAPDLIIKSFLNSYYHDRIPFSELTITEDVNSLHDDIDEESSPYVLNVYKTHLLPVHL